MKRLSFFDKGASGLAIFSVSLLTACNAIGGTAQSSSIPNIVPGVAATVTPRPAPSLSAVITAALVSGQPIALPNIGDFHGKVTYVAEAGQSFPKGATVQLQSFLGAPAGSPAAQSAARKLADLTPEAVVSLQAVFNQSQTIGGTGSSMQMLFPTLNGVPVNAQTYDVTTGTLLATVQGTSTGGGNYTLTSTGTSYVVFPNHVYLTLIVANSKLANSSPTPSAKPTALINATSAVSRSANIRLVEHWHLTVFSGPADFRGRR